MYRLMILTSFVLGLLSAALVLKRQNVKASIIGLSVILEMTFTFYMALIVTVILSGAKSCGLNSTGGALGLILGVIVFGFITPQYRKDFWIAYTLSLPLMYGVGKIGCSFAGCCAGICYDGIFHIATDKGNLFPVQITEVVIFILLYIFSMIIYYKDMYNPFVASVIYAVAKILLDFLRDTHEGRIISTNQIMCLTIVIILIVYVIVRKRHESKS
ncbi:prolipoprotein diacylglyceryl transferase family protein [Butyrivibrio fibrisolvens]|uniref:Prolipoprotein diacylglyceryltransferase n=1 Tax=Butyrivibrio fibrisolvens TaxID=831 RepID=A0A317G0E9_BUTFI|nr:prolipoprotein diacylglyceryl transferase family protein [Butyrivibrio fibrisolvens]PWT26816.1 hypothetical protein CPT75_06710 [Butyrivibrio fibrisolvens]